VFKKVIEWRHEHKDSSQSRHITIDCDA
jgi:hypothetical protein